MNSEIRWKVVTVPVGELESRLQQLTDEDYEIFSIHRVEPECTVVARTTGHQAKGKTIGFRPPGK